VHLFMNLQLAFMQLLNGLGSGMIIFLVAVGLSIIFGTLKVLNLAHAAFYMLGAYLCYWVSHTVLSNISGNFWITLLLAPIITAIFGGALERLIIRRIYGLNIMYQFILTFGISLVIADSVKFLWGREVKNMAIPYPFDGSIFVMGANLLKYQLFLYIMGVSIYIGLLLLLHKTKLGKLIRAVTHNQEMASALGINVPSVYTGIFMLGSWLAGIAGIVAAPVTSITLGMDHVVLIQCFVVVVIGGMGSLSGAFLGSIIMGLINSFGIIFLPELALVFAFLLMAIILIIRPFGLMGESEEAKEKF
jgi:branched-subunit amino acid ABC-type transport system permease component